jgi:hypothetical protein
MIAATNDDITNNLSLVTLLMIAATNDGITNNHAESKKQQQRQLNNT